MMTLSAEQTRAVCFGDRTAEWVELVRPVGPQSIPAWAKDIQVEWMEKYSNSPSIRIKSDVDLRKWDDKRFNCENGRYLAVSEDGRAEQYYHSGPVAMRPLQMFKRADGSIHKHRRFGPEFADCEGMKVVRDGVKEGYEPGEWVQHPVLATTKQDGFGGAVTWVTLTDGREIALCGPWHVSAPKGFVEVSYVDLNASWRGGWAKGRQRKWHELTGMGGLYITEELYLRLMARFQPHLPVARVTYNGVTTVEPFKPEWSVPKIVHLHNESEARRASKAEGSLT